MAHSLTEDNRTALKATYGRFNVVLRAADSVTIRTFNKRDSAAMLFSWNDANRDSMFRPVARCIYSEGVDRTVAARG